MQRARYSANRSQKRPIGLEECRGSEGRVGETAKIDLFERPERHEP